MHWPIAHKFQTTPHHRLLSKRGIYSRCDWAGRSDGCQQIDFLRPYEPRAFACANSATAPTSRHPRYASCTYKVSFLSMKINKHYYGDITHHPTFIHSSSTAYPASLGACPSPSLANTNRSVFLHTYILFCSPENARLIDCWASDAIGPNESLTSRLIR